MTTAPDLAEKEQQVLKDALGLLKDREQVAERLLESSRKHSFDPDTELDWDAPFEDGKWFWPPELVSLYDTPLWRRMSEEQRMDLARHEGGVTRVAGHLVRGDPHAAAGTAHLRQAADQQSRPLRTDRDRRRVPALDDVRAHDQAGRCPPAYPVSRLHHNMARLLKTISTTPGSFTATLLGEEILDWMQRLTFPDERIQPLIRGVTRIHVIEEARHVRYAREELRRQMVSCPRWEAELTRVSSGEAARVFSISFVNPQVYENVGLDKREAVAQVKASGHRREVMQNGARRLTDFLDEIGVLRGVGRKLWVSSGLLAK